MAGRLLSAALIAVGLAACGNASDEESQSQLDPVELSVQEGVFGIARAQGAVVISLVDRRGACGAIQAGSLMRSTTALTFWLRDTGGPVVPGTYQVWGPGSLAYENAIAFVDLTRTSAACASVLEKEQATPLGGQLELTALDAQPGGRASGHYLVRFETGTLEGDFDASWCDFPEDLQPGGLGCQ